VVVDGTETEFEETKLPSHRTVNVSFPKGTQEIWIVGTEVIPEFNEMTIMVFHSVCVFLSVCVSYNVCVSFSVCMSLSVCVCLCDPALL